MHGSLFETRCSLCRREPFPDDREHLGPPPQCDECRAHGRAGLLRPAVVWFGEALDPMLLHQISVFVEAARGERLVFLAVGTSGLVYPAAGLVLQARAAGAEAWLVNAEPPDNARAFHHFVQGSSGRILPDLFEWGS
jgi:NAD-dependent deacetylase